MIIRLLAACYISLGGCIISQGGMEYVRASHTLGINIGFIKNSSRYGVTHHDAPESMIACVVSCVEPCVAIQISIFNSIFLIISFLFELVIHRRRYSRLHQVYKFEALILLFS
jgi:hypothetical protein